MNIDAERRDFEVATKEYIAQNPDDWALLSGHDGEGHWAFIGWQLSRRTPSASIGEDGLPELPAPKYVADDLADIYTADQMRQYARDAVAADRRARGQLLEEFDELKPQAAQGVPVAWAAFEGNGNIRIWTSAPENVRKLAEAVGMELTPLYAAPPLSSESQAENVCWSCKRPYTKMGRINADGHCPHCGVEIAEGA